MHGLPCTHCNHMTGIATFKVVGTAAAADKVTLRVRHTQSQSLASRGLDASCAHARQDTLPPRAFRAAQALVLSGSIALLGLVATLVIFYVMASPTFGWTGARPTATKPKSSVAQKIQPSSMATTLVVPTSWPRPLWLDRRAPFCKDVLGFALLGVVGTLAIFYVMASPTFGWTGAGPCRNV